MGPAWAGSLCVYIYIYFFFLPHPKGWRQLLLFCIYLFLAVRVFTAALVLSLITVSRGYSSCGARLLIAVASLVAARRLQSRGSVVVVHGLRCPATSGIFLDQRLNPVPCIGRQILNHWTTREVLGNIFHSLPRPIRKKQVVQGQRCRDFLLCQIFILNC